MPSPRDPAGDAWRLSGLGSSRTENRLNTLTTS
jgi:hypothetical protein